ncbi:MAG: hypothetical protein NTV65_00740 [Proteobacteria bacterium]|nr:hypothetical protein [Pseudomonadota bacterium]
MRASIDTLVALLVIVVLGYVPMAHAFGPCLTSFPKDVSYIPELAECNGNAAIILHGSLINSFSVVVRACDNGDRDPCFKNADSCGTNYSSPFKVQMTIDAKIVKNGDSVPAKIHCLKEKGSSKVYRMVRRLTIKRVDPVLNPAKDVYKVCLSSRIRARNPVTILSTGKNRVSGFTGFNVSCNTQRYLGCDLDKALARICPLVNR